MVLRTRRKRSKGWARIKGFINDIVNKMIVAASEKVKIIGRDKR